jgi:hypothetical protein
MKLIDVTRQFSTEEKALDYLEHMRWPNGVCCIACGSVKAERLKLNVRPSGKATASSKRRARQRAASRRVYQCLERECLHQFTATTGTVFHKTHLPLNTWFMAIALICDAKKGMSANQLKRHLGINYRTAWFLCHRIREAMAEKGGPLGESGQQVEIDETYIGPKVPRKGKPRTKRTKKDVVMGMIERGGQLCFAIVPDAKRKIMQPVIENNVSRFVKDVFTDEAPTYAWALLDNFEGKHKTICHKSSYGIGDTHTNTIENAFSLLKRGLIGTFHKVSIKHLKRYLNEFSYRFNRRKLEGGMFAETVATLLRRIQLPYKKLTAQAETV